MNIIGNELSVQIYVRQLSAVYSIPVYMFKGLNTKPVFYIIILAYNRKFMIIIC